MSLPFIKCVFVLRFSLLLNFVVSLLNSKKVVTTSELVQVKIYLKYSSGVFQVLLLLNFT